MKRLLIAISLVLSAAILHASPTLATSTGEQINRFDSQVTINRDNKVAVKETIVYDFSTSNRHGIYRDVPIDYRDGNDTYYINFNLIGVWDGANNSLQTELSTESGNKRIRIGNPDTKITGEHTYIIRYELSPLVTQSNSKSFLNLDIVGEGWTVPIYNISANIQLEGSESLRDIFWYGAENLSSNPSNFIARTVPAYNGVTINATLPDGYISKYLQPNIQRSEDVIASIITTAVVSLIVLAGLSGIAIFVARAIRTHSRRKSQIVVAQYEPPVGMSPAHIGLLQDDIATNSEITATVINWAVHGYIKIAYIPKKGLFGSKDYQLIKLKSPDSLSPSEASLLRSFFGDTNQINLSALNKVAVAAQVAIFQETLKFQLTDMGYYDKGGNILMRGTLTEQGAKQWALVDGFKLYLRVVEKDRLTFSDAPEKTPERFNALLPYAIALGVEKQWAKKFKGIDLTTSSTWYSGNLVAFSAASLVADLGGSFATTVSSNSSVSSSGGSSGGGFGGGGGGSW